MVMVVLVPEGSELVRGEPSGNLGHELILRRTSSLECGHRERERDKSSRARSEYPEGREDRAGPTAERRKV